MNPENANVLTDAIIAPIRSVDDLPNCKNMVE